MARQARRRSSTGIYHVMARGIDRRRLFEEDSDYVRFLECVKVVQEISGVGVLAYCLMSNHVHMVVEERDESVSQVFKRIGVRYAGWFNWKYNRTGHLFQDRFRSEPVDDEPYLVTLIRYVHMNPVAAGLCDDPQDYWWSSARQLLDDPLIDSRRLADLCPPAELLGEAPEAPSLQALAHREARRRAFTDEDVAAALTTWESPTTTSFLALPLQEQHDAVVTLREHGVPIRQLSRVTGISKGLIEKWTGPRPKPGQDATFP
ncbi:MAG: transposase [Micrococcales bacterium]|nr:transposase [Micrococcales bacterium]